MKKVSYYYDDVNLGNCFIGEGGELYMLPESIHYRLIPNVDYMGETPMETFNIYDIPVTSLVLSNKPGVKFKGVLYQDFLNWLS